MKSQVKFENSQFTIVCHILDNDRARNAPVRKFAKTLGWRLPPVLGNARYLLRVYRPEEITPEAMRQIQQIIADSEEKPITEEMPGMVFDKCRPHQAAALRKSWNKHSFAFLHRMRTGKTFTTIRLGQARQMVGQIDVMLVVCPMSIKDVWKRQLEWWCQTPYRFYDAHASNKADLSKWLDTPFNGLTVVCVAIESLSAGTLADKLAAALQGRKIMTAVDESTRIKNSTTTRTQKVFKFGEMSDFRLILTGSEITRNPIDLFSQYFFLDEDIFGHSTIYSFRKRYCIMGGFEDRKIIGYANVDEMFSKMGPFTDLVETKDVADLPPKEYETRIVPATAEQKRLISELKREMITELDGQIVEVKGVLAFVTRAHQINGGMFPYQDEEKKWHSKPLDKNPKLEELKDILQEVSGKVVIWCRYRGEMAAIIDLVKKEYGDDSFCLYYGALGPMERAAEEKRFAEDPKAKFMLANQQIGGMGVDFSSAETMIYYSNTFNYEDRIQSEERATSIEKGNKVLIIDIQLDTTTDRNVLNNLKNKRDMADYVTENIKNYSNML